MPVLVTDAHVCVYLAEKNKNLDKNFVFYRTPQKKPQGTHAQSGQMDVQAAAPVALEVGNWIIYQGEVWCTTWDAHMYVHTYSHTYIHAYV